MNEEAKELFNIVKDNYQYELDRIIVHYNLIKDTKGFGSGDIQDITIRIRHIVSNAMRKSIKPYNLVYEKVCQYITDEIII